MKKFTKQMLIVLMIMAMTLFIVACNDGGHVPEADPEPKIEASPEPTPEPAKTPEPPPEPEPALTPEPTPEIIPEPETISFRFPFSFSSVDLQGNTITDEDLGEKELFFAYLWAVW